jgi:protein-S-isoprenylcysteine O-methyltransferase Ste14
MGRSRALLGSAVVLYFLIGLEIVIMISPFAAFFYAAFNPFLLGLAHFPATRWLTAFFLPHMVLPPGFLLKTIRIGGSVLFVGGAVTFLVCAGQVYFNKLFRKGVALRGLYARIRHPQYVGLAATGLGLAILWPRFLVLALWNVMVVLYYVLARDEERRMVARFDVQYREYMERTGMFLPRAIENRLARWGGRSGGTKALLSFAVLACATIGGAFALRAYTVAMLPLWSDGPVTTLALLPGDLPMVEHRMASLLDLPDVRSRLEGSPGPFLVYFIPKDYIMQGMIADTGGEWQLYKRHHTMAMIEDWVFHPFRHLEGAHAMAHHEMASGDRGGAEAGVVRRLIFLRVEGDGDSATPAGLFAIGARRIPVFVADVDVHNVILESVRDLPADSGWGRVPTPMF